MNQYLQAQFAAMSHPYPDCLTPEYGESVEFVDYQQASQKPPATSSRQRRASHNAVERRRRDTITEKIKELDFMIPEDFYDPGMGNISANEKHYKSVVLRRSCEYMRYLQGQLAQAQANQDLLFERLEALEQQPIVKQEHHNFEHIERI